MKLLWKPGAEFTLDIDGKLLTVIIDEKHNNPAAKYTPNSNWGSNYCAAK